MTNIIPSKRKYIIGTRGSLLALTQCGQIKDQLEALTGDEFELKVIKTQGDLIVDKPLWQLEGKDFFTKELDEQLLKEEIDMVVHSYKDLGSERPEGIRLAAITKRDYAQDILFIKKSTVAKLGEMTELMVGTSSPRRIVNIEERLADFIPGGENITIKTKMLRGNVNTRIGKLKDDQYDAIVLAMPGIERLALTENSKKELSLLLEDMTFMVMPQSIFPSAASQGALAIECLEKRNDNGELLDKLSRVSDDATVSEIVRERQAFASYGGGCHLAVGINVMKIGDYYLHVHKGAVDEKSIDDKLLEGSFPNPTTKKKAFIGLPKKSSRSDEFTYCSLLNKNDLKINSLPTGDTLVASRYGIDSVKHAKGAIFASGVKTWKHLAKKGIWVHASADSLGESFLERIRQSKALEIMLGNGRSLSILSHEGSISNYGTIIPVYEKSENELSDDEIAEISACDVFYWTSFSQFESYIKLIPSIKEKFHCSGLGKTLDQLTTNEIKVRPFTSIEEFKKWFKK